MSVDSRTEVIPATGQIRLANANFFFLITASANVTVVLSRDGSTETFALTATGLLIGRLKKWDYAFITGAVGTTLTYFYGITNLREDVTDFRQALATISGTVTTAISPSSLFVDTADTVQNFGTQTVIAANLARRRITIGCTAAAAAPVRVSFTGGANRGIEIQPGTYAEFDTTASLTVRNNDAALGSVWYAEEES